MDRKTKLSDHFTVGEFVKTSQDTVKNPNPKYPNYRYTNAQFIDMNIKYVEKNKEKMEILCQKILEPIRTHMIKHYGFKSLGINSGIRCLELNAVIGGSVTSQHTQCEAADLNIGGTAKITKAVFLDIMNGKVEGLDLNLIGQCILERKVYPKYKTYWIHISYKSPRWIDYKKSKGVSKVVAEFMVTLTGKPKSYYPATNQEQLRLYEE